jgi:hypothetical protein
VTTIGIRVDGDELTTRPIAASKASVAAAWVSIRERYRHARLNIGLVAATLMQATKFRGSSWMTAPKLLGVIKRVDGAFVVWDPRSEQKWTISTEALRG